MFSKVIIFNILAVVCHAGIIVDEGHGHAVSSQSIIRNDQPSHQVTAHFTPVVQHLEHGPALVQQTSYLEHGGQLVHGPVVHAAPVVHHVAPVVQHVSPVVQHVAPAVHTPLVQQVAPVAVAVSRPEHVEEYAPAKYEFSYSVEDPVTGDHKSQREAREGDVVKGEYSLLQPDGTIRRVEYTADQHSGFNAVVSNSAPSEHVTAAPDAHAPPHATPYLTAHH